MSSEHQTTQVPLSLHLPFQVPTPIMSHLLLPLFSRFTRPLRAPTLDRNAGGEHSQRLRPVCGCSCCFLVLSALCQANFSRTVSMQSPKCAMEWKASQTARRWTQPKALKSCSVLGVSGVAREKQTDNDIRKRVVTVIHRLSSASQSAQRSPATLCPSIVLIQKTQMKDLVQKHKTNKIRQISSDTCSIFLSLSLSLSLSISISISFWLALFQTGSLNTDSWNSCNVYIPVHATLCSPKLDHKEPFGCRQGAGWRIDCLCWKQQWDSGILQYIPSGFH